MFSIIGKGNLLNPYLSQRVSFGETPISASRDPNLFDSPRASWSHFSPSFANNMSFPSPSPLHITYSSRRLMVDQRWHNFWGNQAISLNLLHPGTQNWPGTMGKLPLAVTPKSQAPWTTGNYGINFFWQWIQPVFHIHTSSFGGNILLW